jgi:predicted Rossmann-fold nucleotide-binding protein
VAEKLTFVIGVIKHLFILLNFEGYYDRLLQLMDRALEDGLVSENNIIIVVDSVDGLVDRIMKAQVSEGPPTISSSKEVRGSFMTAIIISRTIVILIL